MEKIVNNENCCGCSSCAAVCPRHAITMEYGNGGFLYPIINNEKCVNCNLCSKVCPIIKRDNGTPFIDGQEYYACHNNDIVEWGASSSGGIFGLLANYIIRQKGYVCGAVYDENMKVCHMITNKKEDLIRFRGAKYVQSDTKSIYGVVKKKLNEGASVLFSGTPCQVEALKCFLGKPYNSLYTCDIICNSVPSPLVFKDYILYIEKKYGHKVINLNMRDKSTGWPNTKNRIYFENGDSLIDNIDADLWMTAWQTSLFNRPSCERCRFTNYNRPGDLTIGDCWSVYRKGHDFFSPKGISQLLINSPKGKLLFEEVKDDMSSIPITKDFSWQSKLEHPVSNNPSSSLFWRDYKKMSFKKIAKKYWNYSPYKYKVRRFISMMLSISRVFTKLL